MNQTNENGIITDNPIVPVGEVRPWAVKALTALLFVQAAGLLAIGISNFLALNLDTVDTAITWLTVVSTTLGSSGIFGALALLALLAALSFFGLWRGGWSAAMLTQGLTLAVALALYFRGGGGNGAPDSTIEVYVYLMMVYAIFMVVYLHHPDVQATFRVGPVREREEIEA